MKHAITFCLLILSALLAQSQTNPAITSWWINSDSTIVQGVVAGVHRVDYTGTNVYVTTSGVPEYYVNGQSVNNAAGQNWVFRLPLTPQEQTGAKTQVPMGGAVGVFVDGSVIFGPLDAMSWNNGNVWHRIAYFFEGTDFDSTNGHSTPNHVYHHHVDAIVLHDFNSAAHSPLIGFAFDGFPVYGPFGYVNPDGTGGIKRMTPGYQLRNISDRQTLPNGSTNPGPAIDSQYPLGCFQEDYEYVQGSGDLDEYNGRLTVTPEYPSGTYAYFATIDNLLQPVYPYFLGQSYYGVLDNSNTGPNGGHNTIPGGATQYVADTTTGIRPAYPDFSFRLMPNPANDFLRVETSVAHCRILIFNSIGENMLEAIISQEKSTIDISNLPPGNYIQVCDSGKTKYCAKFIKQ